MQLQGPARSAAVGIDEITCRETVNVEIFILILLCPSFFIISFWDPTICANHFHMMNGIEMVVSGLLNRGLSGSPLCLRIKS